MSPPIPPRGEFDDTMGEISGFGGGYELACRQMLRQGLAWFDAHPDARPEFHGFKGVFGLCMEDNDDAKALSKAVCADVDPTGAMHQAVIGHLFAIKRLGWEGYVAEMRKPDPAEEPAGSSHQASMSAAAEDQAPDSNAKGESR